MFIIKKISDNSLHLWTNLRTENFAMYLPKNLNTNIQDIEIYLLPDSTKNKIEVFDKIPKAVEISGIPALELYESLTAIEEDAAGQPLEEPILSFHNLLETIPTKLIEYPYDKDGNFVIPEEFIP